MSQPQQLSVACDSPRVSGLPDPQGCCGGQIEDQN